MPKCLWKVFGKVKHIGERTDPALTVLVDGLTTVAAVGTQLLHATLMVAHGSFSALSWRLAARVFRFDTYSR